MEVPAIIKDNAKILLASSIFIFLVWIINIDIGTIISGNLFLSYVLTFGIAIICLTLAGIKMPLYRLAIALGFFNIILWFLTHQMNFLVLEKPIFIENYIFLILLFSLIFKISGVMTGLLFDTILEK